MVTRIFLCSERSEPDIRTFIQEAMEDIADGERYVITWNCGNVQTVKVGDRAYFKRIGSATQGYFACGQVVSADPEYQLRQKSNRYRDLSDAYDVDMVENSLRVWVAWDSCVDFDEPLSTANLRQLPQFQGLPLEPQAEAGVFREEYARLLDREWDRYSLTAAKSGKGLRLVDVYYRWGKEDTEDGAWEEAINSFTQAIRLRPNFAKAYISRADVYMTLKKYPEAIADLGQAIYLNPDKAKEGYYKRGLAHSKLGQYDNALADLQEAIAIDDRYLEALFALANSYFKLKSFEQAIVHYSKIIAIDDNFGNALYRRGRSYFMLKEFANAVRDFTEAIRLEPTLATAYYYRGLSQSQAELGQMALAKADLQQAAKLFLDQGKADKASEAMEMIDTIASDRDIETPIIKNLPERKILQITDKASAKELLPPQREAMELVNAKPTDKPNDKPSDKLIILNIGERSATEKAALVAVTSQYAQAGWQVRPVDKTICGYDLCCDRGTEQEQALIKDVPSPTTPFVLTALEITSAKESPHFVLWTVSHGQDHPVCQRWTGPEVLAQFQIEPVKYMVKPKANPTVSPEMIPTGDPEKT